MLLDARGDGEDDPDRDVVAVEVEVEVEVAVDVVDCVDPTLLDADALGGVYPGDRVGVGVGAAGDGVMVAVVDGGGEGEWLGDTLGDPDRGVMMQLAPAAELEQVRHPEGPPE